MANATDTESRRATERFQAVADAYYVLSDASRRREYDALYSSRSFDEKTEDPSSSNNFFAQFVNMFGGGSERAAPQPERPDAEGTFADVFEEVRHPASPQNYH